MIHEVERQAEKIYEHYSLPQEIRSHLEKVLMENIQTEKDRYAAELDGMRREKVELEHKSQKLLEAHYNDAIPLALLKHEQQKIAKQMSMIDHELKAYDDILSSISTRLHDAFDLIEDCGTAYKLADDHIKKMFNQVLFTKLWVESDGQVTADLAEPFSSMVTPVEEAGKEKIRNAEAFTDFLSLIANRVSRCLRRGLNKNLLVGITGLELLCSLLPCACM